jgi:hypothetical protein
MLVVSGQFEQFINKGGLLRAVHMPHDLSPGILDLFCLNYAVQLEGELGIVLPFDEDLL